ncbi:uncharacterized protein LOC141894923 [Acropora palmata]|uniref:uncharacterized protein LOC141894923 n=1 Tax=Acropora palmata TaxID=6131 RepID=UPI003DA1A81E
MLTQGRKYFRFSLLLVAAFSFNFGPVSPSPAISIPKACTEVVQNHGMTQAIDLKLVSNIVSCLRDLQELYKSADWRAIQSLIPNEVKDVIRKAPKLWKNSVDIAKQSPGMSFVSVYLVSRAVDMYDQTMRLQMVSKLYKKEFEWLQKELNAVLNLIHKKILPAPEYFPNRRMVKFTEEVLTKLDRFYSDHKQLIQQIRKDIPKVQRAKREATIIGIISIPVLLISLLFGNALGVILSGIAGATSLFAYFAQTNVIEELESLLRVTEVRGSREVSSPTTGTSKNMDQPG